MHSSGAVSGHRNEILSNTKSPIQELTQRTVVCSEAIRTSGSALVISPMRYLCVQIQVMLIFPRPCIQRGMSTTYLPDRLHINQEIMSLVWKINGINKSLQLEIKVQIRNYPIGWIVQTLKIWNRLAFFYIFQRIFEDTFSKLRFDIPLRRRQPVLRSDETGPNPYEIDAHVRFILSNVKEVVE